MRGVGRAGRRRTLTLACVALLLGCSLDVQTIRYPEAAGVAPREPGCAVRLIDWYRAPEDGCRELGDVSIGNPGFSFFQCDQAQAEQAIRNEACLVGADTAMVRRIKDAHAACYQARARLLRCDAGAAPAGS